MTSDPNQQAGCWYCRVVMLLKKRILECDAGAALQVSVGWNVSKIEQCPGDRVLSQGKAKEGAAPSASLAAMAGC